MSHRPRASRYRRGRSLIAGGLALVSVVAVVVVAVAVMHPNMHPTAATKASYVPPTCGPSGCAVVNMSRTSPPIGVFYGASCSGVYGSWFFNAVEGGPNDQPHPSYSLSWTFSPGATVARPSGRVDIAPTSRTQIDLTLSNGKLSLAGVRKPNVRIVATGTLVVEISGSTSTPALKFTERGLTKAENALGLVSPFMVAGESLTVPVKTVSTMAGC